MIRIALIGPQLDPQQKVAAYLKVGHQFKVMPMKEGVSRVYRTIFHTEKWSQVRWEQTVRIYDAIYAEFPDAWIGYLRKQLATTTRDLVVPDVRYVDELNKLRAMGFIIVRVRYNTERTNVRPSKSLLNAKEGTVIVNEYYGKLPVDYSIVFENRQNMKESVDWLVSRLKEDAS